jgi:hypothetical protein
VVEDTAANRLEDLGQLLVGRGIELVESGRDERRRRRVDALQDECVEVRIEIERAPEALQDTHRARAAAWDSQQSGATLVEGEDRPQEDAARDGREVRISGEQETKGKGEGQNPLPHGNFGQDPIDQLRGALRHPTAAARGTEPASLAGEGDERVLPTGSAAHAGEAVGQDSAGQVPAQFSLDEPGQARPRARFGAACEKSLEVRSQEAVQDPLLRLSAAVGPGARLVLRESHGEGQDRRGGLRVAPRLFDPAATAC